MRQPIRYRDRDTNDGGENGEIAFGPQEVDAIFKRAWEAIYDGMTGCMEKAIDTFFDHYANDILKQKAFSRNEIGGRMVSEPSPQLQTQQEHL